MQNNQFRFSDERINRLLDKKKKVLLVTMHRRENWGEPLKNLCKVLLNLNQKQNW